MLYASDPDFVQHFQSFLRQLRKEAARHGRPLEEILAESLQRLFLQSEITVVIQSGFSRRIRAARSTDAQATRIMDAHKAQEVLHTQVPANFSLRRDPSSSRGVMPTDQGYVICLSGSLKPGQPWKEDPILADFFWIFVAKIKSPTDVLSLRELEFNTEELDDLYVHLQATLNIARVPQFHRALQQLRQEPDLLLTERIQRASQLIAEIGPYVHPSTFETIAKGCDELGRWVVQEVIGTSWSASLGDGATYQEYLHGFFRKLNKIPRPLKSDNEQSRARYSQRFKAYELIAGNQGDWTIFKKMDLEKARADHLSLLGRWTRLQRSFSGPGRPPAMQEGYETAWEQSVQLTLKPLAKLLAQGWDSSETDDARPSRHQGFSAWLSGWIALEMLRGTLPKTEENGQRKPGVWENNLLASERLRLHSHLSVLVRESFRQVEFGASPDFNFDPKLYLRALSAVVEHHAHNVVGVPREIDLRDLLKTVGEARDADDYPFAASHLQHVLQVYLAGHFLTGLRLDGAPWTADAERPWSLLEALAGRPELRPGELSLKDLRQAFSLAALFHDTGMLLFPRVFFPARELPHGDRFLSQRLELIHRDVDQAAKELMTDCLRELRENEYFDPLRERPLALWLQEETDAARLDHSLLGAWYLHRIAGSSQEISRDVVRQAVRAILLHQVVTQPIDSGRDPVAALLVLCDELMDWRPSGRSKDGLPVGRPPLGRRQLDVRPEGSRARKISIEGLHCDGDTWTLTLRENKPWPCIEIQLQEPDHLTMPVYQTWLLMFENLGRLSDGHPTQWAPSIDIVSSVPGHLAALESNHLAVLDNLIRSTRLPCRAHLRKWLNFLDVIRKPGKELFSITSVNGDRWKESFVHSFEELSKEFGRILLELGHYRLS
jgi:hypothetical protein